ncbi:MAG: hypothetical protein HQ559_10605 [Lentisphaerae bacterium]|nr:hypothetical protein [Lentisphaerota bacterium]
MNAKKTTFGADPLRMADILSMGTGADSYDLTPDEVREELLGRRLGGSLPLTQMQAADLAVFVGELRERLPLQGRALGEVILDEETELDTLVEIKKYGKALSTATESEIERDVGLAIYYAAIASAILFCDQVITSRSVNALADVFGTLVDKRWLNPKLARHLAKARKACGKKMK